MFNVLFFLGAGHEVGVEEFIERGEGERERECQPSDGDKWGWR